MRFSRLAAFAALMFAVASSPARSAFPDHPIEFLCATSAGSGAANWCLLMAELTGKELGQPVKVLFKPSGAGNEAATYVDERPADGYTWLQRNTSYGGYMSLPTFRPNPKDFEVVVEVEKFLYVIAVRADSPYKTFQELLDAMKTKGESISFAANKPGSAHHLHLVKLFNAAGVKWKYVPYAGAGGAMRDTLGGHVDVAIGPPGIWLPHVESGDARFLLLINEEHLDKKGLKGLPIPSDFGLNYNIIHQVQGIFVKKGTPEDVTDKIAAAFKAATQTEKYKEYLKQNPHVVPAFSADIAANDKRFDAARKEMAATLREAGLIR